MEGKFSPAADFCLPGISALIFSFSELLWLPSSHTHMIMHPWAATSTKNRKRAQKYQANRNQQQVKISLLS